MILSSIDNWDGKVLLWFNSATGHFAWFDKLVAFLAVYTIYTIPIILLGCWFYSKYLKRATLQMVLTAVLAWPIFNKLFAHFVWARPRPYLAGGLNVRELVFHRPDYSFPSDHATLLAALAVTAWLLGLKKLGWTFTIIGTIIVLSRIMVGVHFPLDIVAGIIVGTAFAFLVNAFKAPLTRYVYDPIMSIAKKIHLA